jgi:hypothetical protein
MSNEVPDWFDRLHGRGRGSGVRREDQPLEMVEVTGQVLGASEKGLKFYDGSKTCWLPRSRCRETEAGLLVERWLAEKKGLR